MTGSERNIPGEFRSSPFQMSVFCGNVTGVGGHMLGRLGIEPVAVTGIRDTAVAI